MHRITELITSVLLGVTCIVCSSYAGLQLYDRSRTKASGSTGYAAGESLGHLTAVDFNASERTLLLALKSNCVYCSESLPLYRSLIKWRNAHRLSLRVTAVCLEPRKDCEQYLRTHRIEVDSAMELPSGDTKLTGTPAFILVNSRGTIERIWNGMLLRQKRAELALSLFGSLDQTAVQAILSEITGDST